MLQPQVKVTEATSTLLQPEPRPPSCALLGSEPAGHAGAGDAHRGLRGYIVPFLRHRVVTLLHLCVVTSLHCYILNREVVMLLHCYGATDS